MWLADKCFLFGILATGTWCPNFSAIAPAQVAVTSSALRNNGDDIRPDHYPPSEKARFPKGFACFSTIAPAQAAVTSRRCRGDAEVVHSNGDDDGRNRFPPIRKARFPKGSACLSISFSHLLSNHTTASESGALTTIPPPLS